MIIYGIDIKNEVVTDVTDKSIILSGSSMISSTDLIKVQEAPQDDKEYMRKNATWTEIVYPVAEAPKDDKTYGRKDGTWEVIDTNLRFTVSKGHKTGLLPLQGSGVNVTFGSGEALDDTNTALMALDTDTTIDISGHTPDPDTHQYMFIIAKGDETGVMIRTTQDSTGDDLLINYGGSTGDYSGGYKRFLFRVKTNSSSELAPFTGEKAPNSERSVNITLGSRYTKNLSGGTVSNILPIPDDVELVGYHKCQRNGTGGGSCALTFSNNYQSVGSNNYSINTLNLAGCGYGQNVQTVSNGLSLNQFVLSGYIQEV